MPQEISPLAAVFMKLRCHYPATNSYILLRDIQPNIKVKFSICLPWRHLRGGRTAPLLLKFCITMREWSISLSEKKFGGSKMRYAYYREEKQSYPCWKSNNISTVLRLVTIPTMLHRSSCVHNTDYATPFSLWSQYRLCYTVRLVVTIPTMLHRSSCGHNTDYATPFVLWSQYWLCYTVRVLVTIPDMLYRSHVLHPIWNLLELSGMCTV